MPIIPDTPNNSALRAELESYLPILHEHDFYIRCENLAPEGDGFRTWWQVEEMPFGTLLFEAVRDLNRWQSVYCTMTVTAAIEDGLMVTFESRWDVGRALRSVFRSLGRVQEELGLEVVDGDGGTNISIMTGMWSRTEKAGTPAELERWIRLSSQLCHCFSNYFHTNLDIDRSSFLWKAVCGEDGE